MLGDGFCVVFRRIPCEHVADAWWRNYALKFPAQVDVPYQYLTFFMEDDDELKRIGETFIRLVKNPGDVSPCLGYIVIERVTYMLAKDGA